MTTYAGWVKTSNPSHKCFGEDRLAVYLSKDTRNKLLENEGKQNEISPGSNHKIDDMKGADGAPHKETKGGEQLPPSHGVPSGKGNFIHAGFGEGWEQLQHRAENDGAL